MYPNAQNSIPGSQVCFREGRHVSIPYTEGEDIHGTTTFGDHGAR